MHHRLGFDHGHTGCTPRVAAAVTFLRPLPYSTGHPIDPSFSRIMAEGGFLPLVLDRYTSIWWRVSRPEPSGRRAGRRTADLEQTPKPGRMHRAWRVTRFELAPCATGTLVIAIPLARLL